mgnify:FL=1
MQEETDMETVMTENDLALLREARESVFGVVASDAFLSRFDTEAAREKAESIAYRKYIEEESCE